MIKQFVKLKDLNLDPQKSLELVDVSNYDLSQTKIYNTIFSTGYNIDKENINIILTDVDWQVACMYGLNLCFLYPLHPSNHAILLFLKYEYDIDFPQIIIDVVNEIIINKENIKEKEGKIKEVVFNIVNDKLFPKFLNHPDNFIKMIIFKALIDISALIIGNVINYLVGDKNIEEELKNKIIPM